MLMWESTAEMLDLDNILEALQMFPRKIIVVKS